MSEWHPSVQVLGDFMEGRLSDEEQSRVEVHLESCQPCSQQLRGISLGDWAQQLVAETSDAQRISQGEKSLSEQLLRIERETGGISALQREIVERHYVRGEPLSVISRELGLSTVDAASHLRKAVQVWRAHASGDADS